MPDVARGPTPSVAEEAQARSTGGVLLLVGVLIVSAFVMILNETVLSVALKDLSVDLAVSATTVQWLTSGFLLTMAVVIPTTGLLLERFTARQVFLVSLSLFSAGTLIAALAPGFAVLLVARVIQACGTALMLPLLTTSVMRVVPPDRRGTTMGTVTIVIAVAPALGPTIGGAILEYLGWRWMFWLVLPLALLALVIGALRLHLPSPTRPVPFDAASVVLSAVGFAGLLYGLSSLGDTGSGSGSGATPWISIVVGVIALGVFVVRQLRLQRDDRALLDLRPFTRRRFTVAIALCVPLFMCLIGASSILLPLYLQTVLHTSTFVSGLAVLPGGLALGVLGRPVGSLYDRVGARPLVIPGAVALAVALWLFASLGEGSALASVIGIHVLFMVGLGLILTPLMTDSLIVLPDRLYSHGSAIRSTVQQVCGAFGTAVFVTVSALGSTSGSSSPDAAGLRLAFVVAAVLGLVALVTSFFVPGRRTDPATAVPAARSMPETTQSAAAATAAIGATGDRLPGEIVGQVTTVDGRAATVTLVDGRGRQCGRARTSDGDYLVAPDGAGALTMIVQAAGHRPDVRQLQVPPAGVRVRRDVTLESSSALPGEQESSSARHAPGERGPRAGHLAGRGEPAAGLGGSSRDRTHRS